MKLNQKRIAEIMEEQCLSQSDVSKRLGCSRQNFSFIFNRGTCALKTLIAIANALDVPISEIADDAGKGSDSICPITRSICLGSGCAWSNGDSQCAVADIALSLVGINDFLHTDSLHVVNYEGT